VIVPWTQSLHLYWRPELRFYEKRIAILKQFEEQGILRAFRVEEGFVDAQLFESRDRLTVKKDGLDLQLFSPDADPERAMEALGIALSEAGPTTPRVASATFQYIVEIDLEFAEAVDRGYGRVLGDLPGGDLSFGDWAVLTDISLDEPDCSGTVEFGIIQANEAPRRLARLAGRAGEGRAQSLQRWEAEEFPDVAIFCDGALNGTLEGKAENLASSAAEFWNAARSAQGKLTEGLRATLSTDDFRRVEAR
jgi:hypothetical protein